MPASTYPTEPDLLRFLFAASLIDSATSPTGGAASLHYAESLAAAISEFERRTLRSYAAVAGSETFDPPTNGDGLLDLEREWATITAITQNGNALTLSTDYYLEPTDGPPYRLVRFYQRWHLPLSWSTRRTLIVTGTRGGVVPYDVWMAILSRAGMHLVSQIGTSEHGALESFTEAGVTEKVGGGKDGGPYAGLLTTWGGYWQMVLDNYARSELIF